MARQSAVLLVRDRAKVGAFWAQRMKRQPVLSWQNDLKKKPLPQTAANCFSSLAAKSVGMNNAAPHLLLRRSPIASPPFGRCLFSHMAGPDPGRVEFVVGDKDLEDDVAMWHLYERWCKAYGQERSPEEMYRRLDYFSYRVLFVVRHNEKAIRDGRSARLAVNMYADGKLAEQQETEMPFYPNLFS